MPKVKMLKNTPGANDGINVIHYLKDKEYIIGDDLTNAFLSMGVCEIMNEQKAMLVPENKEAKPVGHPNEEVKESEVEKPKKKKRGK